MLNTYLIMTQRCAGLAPVPVYASMLAVKNPKLDMHSWRLTKALQQMMSCMADGMHSPLDCANTCC